MDPNRFDRFSRELGRQASRRGVLAGILAGLSGGSWVLADPRKRAGRGGVTPEGPCGNGRVDANRCKKDGDCCTGYCNRKNKRCRCRHERQSCTEDRNCCHHGGEMLTCQQETCQPAPEGCTPDNCPNGCCEGDQCQPGNVDDACGVAGVDCQVCSPCETCQSQVCAPLANGPTCGGVAGCDGTCCGGACCDVGAVCNAGSCCTPSCPADCGSDGCGGWCGACPAGKVCVNGGCSSACNPGPCTTPCLNCVVSPDGAVTCAEGTNSTCTARCRDDGDCCPNETCGVIAGACDGRLVCYLLSGVCTG
jgi:hypothetical protein